MLEFAGTKTLRRVTTKKSFIFRLLRLRFIMDNINFNNKNINYIYNSVLDLCLKFLTLLRYDKNTYMDI